MFDQDAVDRAIVELDTTTFYASSKLVDMDDEYDRLIKYLCYSWELEGEDELLSYMDGHGIKFWSPIPNEDPRYYELFMIYMQLPASHRTPLNVSRVRYSAVNNVSVSSVKGSVLKRASRLFWEIRTKLYNDSFLNSLTDALHDNQKHRINAMRTRSLTIAGLGSDIATELLIGLAGSIREIDYASLSPNQVVKMLGAATKLANESSVLAEKSLMLSEIIETLHDLEEIEDDLAEEKRFINAEVVVE